MKLSRLLVGLFLITIGVVFLLQNMGYAAGELLNAGKKFWPLILIVLGLGKISRGEIPRWLGLGIALLLAAGIILWVTFAPAYSRPAVDSEIVRDAGPGLLAKDGIEQLE